MIIHNELVHLAESVTMQLQQQASNFGHHPASCASQVSQLCHQQHRHRPLTRTAVTGARSASSVSALAKHHSAQQRLEQGCPQPFWSFHTDFFSLYVPRFWDRSETGLAWEAKSWAVPTKILCSPSADLRTRLTAKQPLSKISTGIE